MKDFQTMYAMRAELLAVLEGGPKRTHELAALFSWRACRSLTRLASDRAIGDLSEPLTAWRDRLWGLPGSDRPGSAIPPLAPVVSVAAAVKPPPARQRCRDCVEQWSHGQSGLCRRCQRAREAVRTVQAPVIAQPPAPLNLAPALTVVVEEQEYTSIWHGRDPLPRREEMPARLGSTLSGGTFMLRTGTGR